MPRISIDGKVAMGVGGGQVTVDGNFVAQGGCVVWLSKDEIVFNGFIDDRWAVGYFNTLTGEIKALPNTTGANEMAAGGGRWAAWQAGRGVYGDIVKPEAGLSLTDADGRGGSGDDGTIALVKNRQTGVGLQLCDAAGNILDVPNVAVARQVHVVSSTQAIWRDDAGRLHTTGLQIPVQVGQAYGPRWVDIPGQTPWVVYWSTTAGLIAHPVDSTVGVKIASGNNFFHDARLIDGRLFVVWSGGQLELPGELGKVENGDAFTLPRQELSQTPPVEIPVIGKPCWVAWFEFNQPPPTQPPGNAIVAVRYPTESYTIRDYQGRQFAQFIEGKDASGHVTVEEIERQAAAAQYDPVVYWDGRNWPRWPVLPMNAWLGFQWYCSKGETVAAFENDLRRILNSVPPHFNRIAGICQAYTQVPVNKLTEWPDQLVPVFARLARDYPRCNFLLPFSDAGRDGGMTGGPTVSHPELRPLWQRLVEGVTGVPSDDNGGSTMDWATIDQYGKERWAQLEVNRKSQELVDQGLECRDFQKDCFVKIASELYYDKGIHLELFWKAGLPEYGNPQDVKDKLAHIGEDIIVEREAMIYKDVVGAMGHPSANWNAGGAGASITPGDENRCGKPPRLEGEIPEPTPDDVKVTIYRYDPTFVRGGEGSEHGMEIVFEVASGRRIIEMEVYLDDGSPRFNPQFPAPPDGIYWRGLRFKPVINGSWFPVVRAKSDQGVWGEARGTSPVVVTSI